MTVTEYIKANLPNTICYNPEDKDKLLGLPLPYSVPTVGETFHALFYWDTYFTNLAHLILGDVQQVKNNLYNFASLIDRLGFIPNGNKTSLNDRSQPPFFALMVEAVYQQTGDKELLEKLYPSLCKEHAFWDKERNTERGLAHYGEAVLSDREEKYARTFASRVGVEYTLEQQKNLAENFLAQAESGWDFSARFEFDSLHYCPVDLNSLLWALEDRLSKFSAILGNGEEEYWRLLANRRGARMRAFLKNKDGIFCDRNDATGAFSPVSSAASFYPLFVGLADQEEAGCALQLLAKLLHKWGIVPCEEQESATPYQWGSPNGWPCLQVIASAGLQRYGFKHRAQQIAELYVSMVDRVFEETGALWEKYNMDTGKSDAVNEYEMPEMLGWTAGAYLYFKNQLDGKGALV